MSTDILESSAHSRAGRRRAKKGRKRTIAAVTAVVLAGGVGSAFAAYQLFGFGSIKTDIAVTKGLTVPSATAKLTRQLVPGVTSGVTFEVTNPNDFPVTVTGVVASVSSLKIDGNAKDCLSTVKLAGTPGTYPGEGGGAGMIQKIEKNVPILPGNSATVTVPEFVKQDASGTGLCSISADFAVQGQTAS